MVLFIDSNEYRRDRLARACRTNNIPSMAVSYDYYKSYTLPLVTVLVDPKRSFVADLKGNENTLFIIVVKWEGNRALYPDYCTFCNSKGEITPDEIKSIVKEKLGLNFDTDYINLMRIIADEGIVKFYGRSIPLGKSDLKILRFFLYNHTKTFRYDEVFEYLHYTGRIKDKTFDGYVQRINRTTIEHHREKMIYKRKLGYEMPILKGKNPHLYDQRFNIFAT